MSTFAQAHDAHINAKNFLPSGELSDGELDMLVRRDWAQVSERLTDLFAPHFLTERLSVDLSVAEVVRTCEQDGEFDVERAKVSIPVHPKGVEDSSVKLEVFYVTRTEQIPTLSNYLSGRALRFNGEFIDLNNVFKLIEHWDSITA